MTGGLTRRQLPEFAAVRVRHVASRWPRSPPRPPTKRLVRSMLGQARLFALVQNKAAVPDGVDVAETRATDRGKRMLRQIRGENIRIRQAERPCIPRAPIAVNVVYARV